MKKLLTSVALSALLTVTAPASAALVQFNLDTGGTNSGGSNAGNIRTFTSGGVTITASAWNMNPGTNPDSIQQSYLGQYSGNGLGVTSSGESSSGNGHTVDNQGRTDFIVLKFSQAVSLKQAYLVPFQLSGVGGTDSDASILYDDNPFSIYNNMTASSFYGQFENPSISVNVSGNADDDASWRTITAANQNIYADVWVVSAALVADTGSGDYYDAFKLKALKVDTAPPPPPLPEPATWAMMISGFGLVGGAMRRRRAGTPITA